MPKTRESKYANYPYVSNYPPLQEWLHKHTARCISQLAVPHDYEEREMEYPQQYIEFWIVGKRVAIITIFSDKKGWDIYTSADTIYIQKTLADAEQRLGIRAAETTEA